MNRCAAFIKDRTGKDLFPAQETVRFRVIISFIQEDRPDQRHFFFHTLIHLRRKIRDKGVPQIKQLLHMIHEILIKPWHCGRLSRFP